MSAGIGYLTLIPSIPVPHPLACVTRSAVAHNLLRVSIPVARSSKVPLASRAFGAGARSALASVCQPWVPMKTSNAPAGK